MNPPECQEMLCKRQAALMHAVTHRQRRGISAEPTDCRFPHRARADIEDEVELDIAHQPRGLRELLVELSRSPPRIPGEHARTRRGTRFEHMTQQRRRRGQIQTVAYGLELR